MLVSGVRVVVTGGAGFIGGHLVARLVAERADVLVIDDLSTGRPENLAEALSCGLRPDRVRVCDIRSAGCVELIKDWKPEMVIHLAAQVSMPRACSTPQVDADVNITGTVNVAEACVRAGAQKLVFAASCAIYGLVELAYLPLTELVPMRPVSPYGLSKATALHYLGWYRRERGLACTALVLGNVYGPRQAGGAVVARMVSDLEAGKTPVIVGDGQQTRDFVYISDVVDAIALACRLPSAGLVNIGSGVESSVAAVFQLICDATGSATIAERAEPVMTEVRRMVLDCQRAESLLGWRAKVSLAEGIKETVRYLRSSRMEVA